MEQFIDQTVSNLLPVDLVGQGDRTVVQERSGLGSGGGGGWGEVGWG